jgi:hypothetical protein
MRRTPLFLILFAGSAAWAGAQHRPDTSKRVEMLAKNRTTLLLLVDRGLDLGATDDEVSRVKLSRQAAETVRRDLADAAATHDVDRVVELGEHLTRLYDNGLVQTLDAATRNVPEGSPAMDELKAVRREAIRDADTAAAIDFVSGKFAGSGRVKGMVQNLFDAVAKVKAAAGPKKN